MVEVVAAVVEVVVDVEVVVERVATACWCFAEFVRCDI